MATHVGSVLVGTDFSDAARVALQEARRLAAQLGTHVEVLHVVDSGRARGLAEPTGSGGAGDLAGWLNDVGMTAGDLLIRYGSAWVELTRYAGEVEPIMIVIGSHGRSGYQPLSVGSTATRLSVQARWPVVLVSPRVAVRTEQGITAADHDGAAERIRPLAGSTTTDGGKSR
ncbi:hypothetical protein BH23GEM10_BH23GEM10_04520 [soil metagenome]